MESVLFWFVWMSFVCEFMSLSLSVFCMYRKHVKIEFIDMCYVCNHFRIKTYVYYIAENAHIEAPLQSEIPINYLTFIVNIHVCSNCLYIQFFFFGLESFYNCLQFPLNSSSIVEQDLPFTSKRKIMTCLWINQINKKKSKTQKIHRNPFLLRAR